jgi:hypothetical protein
MLQINSKDQLSKAQIKSIAPSVFTTTYADHLSDSYTHIPTSRVIDDMAVLGWNVYSAKEVKARKQVGFQKHLLVFRNENVVINGEDGDTVYPQILVTNSHDGKNAFQFQSGIFRMICENGLVVASEKYNDLRIRHINYTFEELQEKIKAMVEQLPLTVDSLNRMKQTQLNEEQAYDLAEKSILTRFPDTDIKELNINIDELLNPTRPEDKGKDLFTVFNVLQEKILSGSFTYMTGTKIRKARKVKNFQQDIKLNSQLYSIANEFMEV